MDIKDGRYVSQIWFLAAEDKLFDINGALYRDEGENSWILEYRIRAYSDESENPFDGKDYKKFFVYKITETEEDALSQVNDFFRKTADTLSLEVHSVMCRTSSAEEILEKLSKEPWAHMRRLTPEQYEKEYPQS